MIEDGVIYGMTSQNLGQLTVGPLAFAYQVGNQGREVSRGLQLGQHPRSPRTAGRAG